MRIRTKTICRTIALRGAILAACLVTLGPGSTRSLSGSEPGEALFDRRPLADSGKKSPASGGADASPNTARTEAGVRLIYSNTLGEFVFAPGAKVRVSDDISTIAGGSCLLDRFEFFVSGTNAGAGSGPFSVDFALYDGCPDGDGQIIPETVGHFDAPNEDRYLIGLDVPLGVEIPIPYPLWLGVTFSRANAGWLAGAPALVGYSDDVFDFPGHDCAVTFGRFPTNPYGSFNARVFGRGQCPGVHWGYRANAPMIGGMGLSGGLRIAEDVQLATNGCVLAAFEMGVSGTGVLDFDLRDPETGLVIPGTQGTFEVSGSSGELARFEFDPPIPIPPSLWVTVATDSGEAGVLLINRAPAIGTTSERFLVNADGVWTATDYPGEWFYAAIQTSVTCAGDAPAGACCDMQFPDESGEALCRDVPQANCPYPRWIEGVGCDDEPFDPPCGQAACCLGDGECEDRTANQCVVGGASWYGSESCSSLEEECPFVCVYSEEPCGIPHASGGCLDPHCCATVCSGDPFCCAVRWDDGCVTQAHLDCSNPPGNDECWDGIPALGAVELTVPGEVQGGTVRATNNATDPGFCCHAETPGAPGVGSVWYWFVAPGSSVELSTCRSNSPARDSLIQVFRALDNSSREAACNSLISIACGDNVQPCSNRETNERLCVDGLIPGETYYVMLAAKSEDTRGIYLLEIEAPCSIAPPASICPCGDIRWLEPPDGVVDGRQPHPVQSIDPLQGIDTIRVAGPLRAGAYDCWDICETLESGFTNAISGVVDNADGTYTISLERPITPGAVTTITYAADNAMEVTGTFIAHPGNVDGDDQVNPNDVSMLIEMLSGNVMAPWGEYGTDCDRSGRTTPADLLCVIDLLNGGDAQEPGWNGSNRPTSGGLCPGGIR